MSVCVVPRNSSAKLRKENEKRKCFDTNLSSQCDVRHISCLVYRKWDSNPHSRYGQGILSPSCLPFHHFGILMGIVGAKVVKIIGNGVLGAQVFSLAVSQLKMMVLFL